MSTKCVMDTSVGPAMAGVVKRLRRIRATGGAVGVEANPTTVSLTTDSEELEEVVAKLDRF